MTPALSNVASVRSSRRLRVAAALCLVCASLYLLYTYETFTITRFSMADPLGGVTLFRREHSPCTAPSCEAIAPQPISRGEDKVTVILMGYHTSRIANYRSVFKRYLAMVWFTNSAPFSLSFIFCVICQNLSQSLDNPVVHIRSCEKRNPTRCQTRSTRWCLSGIT